MYVSKKTALSLTGKNGITKTKIDQVAKAAAGAARKAKDINHNGEIDAWELGRAAKAAHLTKGEHKVLFSAFGTAFMTSDPDGRANAVSSGKVVAETVQALTRDLKSNAGRNRTVQAEDIQGKTLSNLEIAILQAAKKAR